VEHFGPLEIAIAAPQLARSRLIFPYKPEQTATYRKHWPGFLKDDPNEFF
jgi:hypothetical protein